MVDYKNNSNYLSIASVLLLNIFLNQAILTAALHPFQNFHHHAGVETFQIKQARAHKASDSKGIFLQPRQEEEEGEEDKNPEPSEGSQVQTQTQSPGGSSSTGGGQASGLGNTAIFKQFASVVGGLNLWENATPREVIFTVVQRLFAGGLASILGTQSTTTPTPVKAAPSSPATKTTTEVVNSTSLESKPTTTSDRPSTKFRYRIRPKNSTVAPDVNNLS